MRVNCHLVFDGQCEAAFRTYEALFGGTIVTLLRFGESPMAREVPPAWQQRVLHATLQLGGHELLLGSDAFPGAYERPQGFSATLSVGDAVQGKAIFEALADGGRIQMPFQETFWSVGFGVLVDRFGVPWEINCEGSPRAP